MATRIVLTVVTLLIALGLAGYLVYDTYVELDKEARIARVEAKVIQKLELIREAQEGHQKLYSDYAGTWDSLRTFIANAEFPIVDVKETIITLEYGADSVVIERDTIGFVSVKDSLFTPEELKFLTIDRLEYVPHPEDNTIKFSLELAKKKSGNYYADLILVLDPKPYDRSRKEENERRTRRPLRFGSLQEVSTAGNWE